MARILGLELGRGSVRGTLVRTALRRAEVLRYVERPIEVPPDDAAPETRAEAIRDAIRDTVAAIEPPPDQVIVAIDGREASLRAVELPAAAARRAAEVLPFELEPLLPFGADEAVLDHQVVDQDNLTLQLLAAAVPKPRVAQLLASLEEAGVDPREVAVGAAALDGLPGIVPATGEGVGLVVHVAAGIADVCVLKDGGAAYSRTMTVGPQWMTQGSPFESELKRSLAAWRASGGDEITRAWISGELPAPPEAPVHTVVAEGDAATDSTPPPSKPPAAPDVAVEWLARVAGVPASRVPLPPGEGADPSDLARFVMSAALGARTIEKRKRFDVRRGEFAYTRTGTALQRYARTAGLGAAAVLAAFAFSTFAEWRVLAGENERLADELERISDESLGEATRSPSRARELLARGSRVDDPIPEVDAFDLLEFTSGAIPTEIAHSTRTFLVELDEEGGDGRFEIVGSVASIAERDAIAQAVEAHGCLKSMERGSTSAEPGGDGRLRYQLEADIRCGEDEARDTKRSRRGRR